MSPRKQNPPRTRAPRRLPKAALDPLNWIALAGGALWLSVAFFGRPIGDFGVETDFYGDFVHYARQWLSGEPSVMNGFRGPFYYLLLAAIMAVFEDAFLWAKVLSALCAAVGLCVLGGLLRSLWGPAAGIGGTLLVLGNPRFAEYAFRAGTDSLFWLLFVAVLAILFGQTAPTPRGSAAAGVLAGLAWLARYNGGVLLPVGLLATLLLVRPRNRALISAGAFVAAWILVAAPWAIYLQRETGDPFWSTAFHNVAIATYTTHPGLAQNGDFMSEVGFTSLSEVVRVDPMRFGRMLLSNVVDHAWQDVRQLVTIPWTLVALAGAAATLRKKPSRRAIAFLAAGAMTYASLLLVFYNPRFMMPLLPWWAAGAGALSAFAARLRLEKLRRIPVALLFAALALAAVVVNFREVRASHDPFDTRKSCPEEVRILAIEARKRDAGFSDRTPVAARKPHIAYYLGTPYMPIPMGTLQDLQDSGAHYLLVSGAEVNAYPGLAILLTPRPQIQIPPALRLVASVAMPLKNGQARAATLYAIQNPVPWAPAPKESPRIVRETIPGLSRLDTLRLRLAQWYVIWDKDESVPDLIARMSEAGRRHPETVMALGDDAFRKRDFDSAEGYYMKALAGIDRPERVRLRLAALYAPEAKGDAARFREEMSAFVALRPDARPDDVVWWNDLGVEHMAAGRYAEAIGPILLCLQKDGENADCWKWLTVVLTGLGWEAEAGVAKARYVRLRPDDPEFAPKSTPSR